MCHAAVNWVLELKYPKAIKPQARWLLIKIADRADVEDWKCWPSHKTLAEDSNMSSRSVLSILAEMEEIGLLTRRERYRTDGTRSTDLIILNRYAKISEPGEKEQDRPQFEAEERARIAALKQVTETGKRNILPENNADIRGTRLPADWEPDTECATLIGLSHEETQWEAEKFKDYWNGKPGAAGRKIDWPGTWRNWCRKRVEDKPHGRTGSTATPGLSRKASNMLEGIGPAPDPRRQRWSG